MKNVLSCICGNKMPTRCNRGFYCRSYCLLNMFRASLCPSSGARDYYTGVAACGILCCGFSSSWSGVELRVMRPVCRMLAFYFHILTRMHGQNHIKFSRVLFFRTTSLSDCPETLGRQAVSGIVW